MFEAYNCGEFTAKYPRWKDDDHDRAIDSARRAGREVPRESEGDPPARARRAAIPRPVPDRRARPNQSGRLAVALDSTRATSPDRWRFGRPRPRRSGTHPGRPAPLHSTAHPNRQKGARNAENAITATERDLLGTLNDMQIRQLRALLRRIADPIDLCPSADDPTSPTTVASSARLVRRFRVRTNRRSRGWTSLQTRRSDESVSCSAIYRTWPMSGLERFVRNPPALTPFRVRHSRYESPRQHLWTRQHYNAGSSRRGRRLHTRAPDRVRIEARRRLGGLHSPPCRRARRPHDRPEAARHRPSLSTRKVYDAAYAPPQRPLMLQDSVRLDALDPSIGADENSSLATGRRLDMAAAKIAPRWRSPFVLFDRIHDQGDGPSAVAANVSDTRGAHDYGERADSVVPLPSALLSLSPLKRATPSRASR